VKGRVAALALGVLLVPAAANAQGESVHGTLRIPDGKAVAGVTVTATAPAQTPKSCEGIAEVLAPMGLRLSPAKSQVVHLSGGFDFPGFRIQRKRKQGTDKWYACTFIASRPIRSLKDKVRALTSRTSRWPSRDTLIRLNQIMRGWANYFRRGLQVHTRRPGRLRLAPGDPLADETAPLGGGKTSAGDSPAQAAGGAGHQRTGSSYSTSVQCRSPGISTGQQDPQPLDQP
jgi:hypothetical protein